MKPHRSALVVARVLDLAAGWAGLVLGFAVFISSACSSSTSDEATRAEPDAPLVVDVDDGAKVRVEEISREDRMSTVRVTQSAKIGATADTLLLGFAIAKFVTARGGDYFTTLKQSSEPDGSTTLVLGLADSDRVDIPDYFGSQYSQHLDNGKERPIYSAKVLISGWGWYHEQR